MSERPIDRTTVPPDDNDLDAQLRHFWSSAYWSELLRNNASLSSETRDFLLARSAELERLRREAENMNQLDALGQILLRHIDRLSDPDERDTLERIVASLLEQANAALSSETREFLPQEHQLRQLPADREALAALMLRHSIPTGHGDTHADLLGELDAYLGQLPGAVPRDWPVVKGIGRDNGYSKSLCVYFDSEPTDDQMRAVHRALRDAPAPTLSDAAGVVPMVYTVHVVGPDDIYEYGDELEALRAANEVNKQYLGFREKHGDNAPLLVATVTPSAPLPEGVVMVPREPTRDMIERGHAALMEWDARTGDDLGIWDVWRAMLAASPSVQDQPTLTHVATLLPPDPNDERDGYWLSLADRRRLASLPAGTKLYAEVQGGEAQAAGVSLDEAMSNTGAVNRAAAADEEQGHE